MLTNRRTMVVAALASAVSTLLVGSGLVWANHQFSDVPTSSPFHDAISAFADAGCATGFPGGTYHPTEAVNRQQIARMFAACAGHMDHIDSPNQSVTTTLTTVTPLTVTSTALGTGSNLLLILAEINVRASGTITDACEVQTAMFIDGSEVGPNQPANIIDTGDATDEENVTLTEVIVLDAGQQVDIDLRTRLDTTPTCGAASVFGAYNLTALQFPFGEPNLTP